MDIYGSQDGDVPWYAMVSYMEWIWPLVIRPIPREPPIDGILHSYEHGLMKRVMGI